MAICLNTSQAVKYAKKLLKQRYILDGDLRLLEPNKNRILDGYFKPFKIYGHLLGSKFKAIAHYLNTSDRLLKIIFMHRDFKANFTKI